MGIGGMGNTIRLSETREFAMSVVLAALMLLGVIPLGIALWHNRRTSLAHALVWALIAWLTWASAMLWPDIRAFRPCALGLTGCTGVAVLGARRPHVAAWNFVVAGLFAVMMWPILEDVILGVQTFEGLRVWFLIGTISVGIINHLPTRMAPAATALGVACGGEITLMLTPTWSQGEVMQPMMDGLVAAVPWIAWICVRTGRTNPSEIDQLWLSFRDRWGLVWSQRVREQFKNSAAHAGWPVQLNWSGLEQKKETPAITPAEETKMLETLRAILQRFL
jgi:hypothetical protein